MKISLTVLLLIVERLCFAAICPYHMGILGGVVIPSTEVEITKAKVYITIDKDFKTAHFVTEYYINKLTYDPHIALLFQEQDANIDHPEDYKGVSKVWVDGQEKKLHNIPYETTVSTNTSFQHFSSSFRASYAEGVPDRYDIYFGDNFRFVYSLSGFKYFNDYLTKGEHKIRVEYTADNWYVPIQDLGTELSFRYSLSPIKHWKSFDSLEIILNTSAVPISLTTNLGEPTRGKIDSISVWNFHKLPADFLKISYLIPLTKISYLEKIKSAVSILDVLGRYIKTVVFNSLSLPKKV